MEIVPGLHRLLGRAHHGVNAYLWLSPGDDPPVLFDCGWPWSGSALAAELRRLGCAPEDLRIIAITHDDVDHAGRLAQLLTVSKATSLRPCAGGPPVRAGRHGERVPGNPGRTDWVSVAAWAIYGRYPHHPVRGVEPLAEGDELPGGWMTLHTPGHTPGHASYYHPVASRVDCGRFNRAGARRALEIAPTRVLRRQRAGSTIHRETGGARY